jgi:hypothetical protein
MSRKKPAPAKAGVDTGFPINDMRQCKMRAWRNGRRTALRMRRDLPCGFKSLRAHQTAGVAESEDAPASKPGSPASSKLAARTKLLSPSGPRHRSYTPTSRRFESCREHQTPASEYTPLVQRQNVATTRRMRLVRLQRGVPLEHFPEKWTPVFRRKCDHFLKRKLVRTARASADNRVVESSTPSACTNNGEREHVRG